MIEIHTESTNRQALEALTGKILSEGDFVSGSPINNFTIGWGLVGFGKAHYYRARRVTIGINPSIYKIMAISSCGLIHDLNLIFEPGNFLRCKRCQHIERR